MLKVLELFAGIGACSKALDKLGIEHKIVDAVEIDKYAIASFNAIHNTNFEPQDITKWDKDLECDLIMHGSPCQDFSVAGKQAGGDIGSGTRSSLMYETIRIVGKLRPKYVVWENVKNLLSKKHKHNFDSYIETMNVLGYNSYYQVLNAKDYGIPQNRERVFTISIRKDIDKSFEFPQKEELKLRLKDMLEDNVDEKYYLSDVQIERIKTTTYNVGKTRIQEKNYCDTLCARDWKDPKCVQVGQLNKTYDQSGRIYSQNGLSPTIMSNSHIGGYTPPKIITHNIQLTEEKILVKNATKKGYDEAIEGDSINLSYPESNTRRGRVGHQVAQTIQCNDMMGVVEPETMVERTPLKFLNRNQKNVDGDYAFCVDSCNTGGVKEITESSLRIRKLTPKECWRLMGFDDEDFEKAKAVPMSNTQLYKQAGNSIVVNVLEKIFKNLLGV